MTLNGAIIKYDIIHGYKISELYLYPKYSTSTNYNTGFFPVFWKHDPYTWNWKFQQCFVNNQEKILDTKNNC